MHHLFGLSGWSSRTFWYTDLEVVLELSWHLLQIAHTSGASGLPSLGLLAPVVCIIVLVQNSSTPQSRASLDLEAGPSESVETYIFGS